MDECKNLYSPDGIRSYTTNIIIGLLWSTGMRPSEPVNLLNEDVDFKNNTNTQKCNGTTLLLSSVD